MAASSDLAMFPGDLIASSGDLASSSSSPDPLYLFSSSPASGCPLCTRQSMHCTMCVTYLELEGAGTMDSNITGRRGTLQQVRLHLCTCGLTFQRLRHVPP